MWAAGGTGPPAVTAAQEQQGLADSLLSCPLGRLPLGAGAASCVQGGVELLVTDSAYTDCVPLGLFSR